jgi:NAD(P)-dependent dehydrogenase (short-subunit alcohol dehydrogenase family)
MTADKDRDTMPAIELQHAVVVITGGCGGIGVAIADAVRRAGATAIRTDLPGRGADYDLDVTDLDATRRVFAEVRDAHGRLDVVIANAGIGVAGLVEDLTPDQWSASIAVNVCGTTNTVQAAYPLLVSQGRGSLVLMASLSGLLGTPLLAPYSMTKHAIVGLGASLRPEAARHGVGVTVACPGPVDTALLDESASTPGISVRRYLTASGGKAQTPNQLADAILDAVRRDRGLVTPGRAGILWRLNRMMPKTVANVVGRNMSAELDHAATL